MTRLLAASVLLIGAIACGAAPAVLSSPALTAGPSATPGADSERLFWGAYQMNAEPHYRLIFEGGAASTVLTDLRLLDASGTVRSSARFSPSATEPMQLCPGGKGPGAVSPGPAGYGPWRATLAVEAQLFKDFLSSPSPFRVEAQVAGAWRTVSLTYLCAASQ